MDQIVIGTLVPSHDIFRLDHIFSIFSRVIRFIGGIWLTGVSPVKVAPFSNFLSLNEEKNRGG